jgi:hypothetical protein
MSRSMCSRLWEAEAAEDGRLDPTALASFERHSSTCAPCSLERAALAHLRSMTAHIPLSPVSQLERKRLRAAILKQSNERLVRPEPQHRWRIAVLLIAAMAVVAGGWGFSQRTRPSSDVQAFTRNVVYELTPIGVARWSLQREGPETRVVLADGTVSVHVAKLSIGQRFVLALPDGEIEVRGTRFVAHVDRSHTRDVGVSEGSVALRIASSPERILGSGESWTAEPDETMVADPPLDTASTKRAPASASIRSVRPSSHPADEEVAHDASAGALFADAMSAFSSGTYRTADALFARFEQKFPNDARSEDAAFLRIVIAKRLGDPASVSRLAGEYLQRHPRGFRRNDVERLSRSVDVASSAATND